ncbi:hypothetical protein [Rhodovulum kholense]|nr:hypothetical protein [Rhodovulum kholense]
MAARFGRGLPAPGLFGQAEALLALVAGLVGSDLLLARGTERAPPKRWRR